MLRKMCLGLAMCCAMVAFGTEGVSEMAVQLFGKQAASKKVEKGAVFIDGLFIPGPYEVSREGNCILINGQVASRFKVTSAASEKAAADAAAAAASEGSDGSDVVSDEDGASIADTPAPTRKGASELDKRLARRGGGIEARLAADRKKRAGATSGAAAFNSEAASTDPTALFEEADYTYTPPKRPDPKPVPYIRPAAAKSTAERLAEAKAREQAQQNRGKQTAAAEEADDEELSVEEFDGLTEAELADYTEQFEKRRVTLEGYLENDYIILLSSNVSTTKAQKRATMRKFILALAKLNAKMTAAKFVAQWKKDFPEAYLRRIYANRAANMKAIKALEARIKRETKSK